jgi:pilus assembly protein CpaC
MSNKRARPASWRRACSPLIWATALASGAGLPDPSAAQNPARTGIPSQVPSMSPLELPPDELNASGNLLALPPLADDGDSKLRLPEIRPKAPKTRQELDSFLDKLSTNDAAFKVEVGQARILSTKENFSDGRNQPLIAVGDPSVIGFTVIDSRNIRVTGQRVGVTDLVISTANGRTFSFEVRVIADLNLLTGKLKAMFPEASIRLGQLRDHVVVEGEARDTAQIALIIDTISAYLSSVQIGQSRRIQGQQGRTLQPGALGPGDVPPPPAPAVPGLGDPGAAGLPVGLASPDLGGPLQVEGAVAPPRIINLLRVPGSQQVMLKVRVAELNRTAMRQIGANFLGVDPRTGAIVGSQIAGPVTATGSITPPMSAGTAIAPRALSLTGNASLGLNGAQSTVFGIFQDANFEFTLNALRQNSFLKVLAEPNLVALSGYQASFLAGGEFPVPVPQVSAGGVAPTITVRFREFGVRLNFVPFIIDGETIRLSVAPEVSQIDFTIATTLVAGGSPVPGLNTRKAQTTVELRQGQTLAIAGLLQLTLSGSTTRIPGLGDLPILGPFFSNTTGTRTEKELVVLVTPYLVEPMTRGQVPPGPGDEVKEPNDLEFYFLNRVEGKTGVDFRSTTAADDPFHLVPLLKLETKHGHGPMGFSN